jgi:membrane protein implicated in regulation of membrane protease activity
MIKNRFTLPAVFLLLISTVLLTACPPHVRLGDLNRDPSRYAGKEITVVGRVVESIGALGFGFYKLDDGTGQLWVYSSGYGAPANGAKVRVVGQIDVQGITAGGRSFGLILRQTERRK